MTSGYTAELGEQDTPKRTFPAQRKIGYLSHWLLRYLVVGHVAQQALTSRVAKKLAIRTSRFWPDVLASWPIY